MIRHEDKVYKLKKALYELKLALRTRNTIIDCFLLQLSCNKCTIDYVVYMRVIISDLMICVYIDDLLVIR